MAKPTDNKSVKPDNTSKKPGGGLDASPQIIPGDTISVHNTIINNNSQKIATGFCNAFGGNPKDSLVNPLKPTSARDGRTPNQSKADRLHDLGMTFQLLLMEQWTIFL